MANAMEDKLAAGTSHDAAAAPGNGAYGPEPSAESLARVDAAGLAWDVRGLIPCIVQQEGSGEVLMMAWMSRVSVALTLDTGTTWFWSRSRRELWNKGATSGNVQRLVALAYDCDADCLLATVDSPGPACHTGARSCFFNRMA